MSEMPEEWTTVALGDICAQPEHRVPASDEIFTYIDIASIDRDLKVISEPQLLRGADAPSRARKAVERGDVIVSMTRPNLNAVALIGEQHHGCIVSTGFDVLKPIQVEPRWIFAAVKSAQFINAMCEKVQGALYPAIKARDIREYRIPLPPLAEQNHIAQKLDELLAQVDSLKVRIDAIPNLLTRFRQSVLTEAISGKITDTNENSELPNGWQLVPFSTVINDLRYGTAQKCDYNGGATGVLRIPNISGNGINLEDLKYSNFPDLEIKKLAIQEGDILLIRSNGSLGLVGKSAIVGKNEEGLLFAGYLIRVRLDRNKVLPEYINYWLKSPSTRQAIELLARSTNGINNINSEEIKSLRLILPPLKDQTKIVYYIEQSLSLADRLGDSISIAQTRIGRLAQSILAKAFSGELSTEWRTENPGLISNENSVKSLLNRIKDEYGARIKPLKPKKTNPQTTDKFMSEEIIKVSDALKKSGKPLSGQQLLAAAGYPQDSNTELVEQFFLDIRNALKQKKITQQPRDKNGQDWFALVTPQ